MIDEKKLIEEIEENEFSWLRDKLDRMQCIHLIKRQPKVGEWIPCSERLPNKDEFLKNDGRFIVTDGNRVYQSIYDIYIDHCFKTFKFYDFLDRRTPNYEVDRRVVAWMPLPDPYRGDSDE